MTITTMLAKGMLIAMVLPSSILAARIAAQSPASPTTPSAAAQSPAAKPSTAATPYRYHPSRFSRRAGMYYEGVWGVDSLGVKVAESGEIIRFSYRVLDADKAKALNDKKNEPSLEDMQARVKLKVPSLEKVGQLRQTSTPVAGKSYWMAFSNPGRVVKRGDRVDVVIGEFRANGLVVE